jgi:hypothetical protein
MTLIDWLKRRLAKDARQGDDDETGGARFNVDDDDDEVDPFNPFPDPVDIEIGDVFDLHTVPPREVKRVVEAYLEEARRKGFRSVRIIHGKGRGVQRETVRAVLSRTAFVVDWTDAPPAAGGTGATVAHLKRGDGG